MGWFFNRDEKSPSFSDHSHFQGDRQPQYQNKSSFHSYYSSSKSCRDDPEDSEYMVCLQTIKQGNNTTQKQERIPKKEYTAPHLNAMMPGVQIFTNQIDELMRSLFGKQFEVSFFMEQPFERFNPNNGDQSTNKYNQATPQQQNNSYKNHNHYFSTQEKDFDVKDL